MIVFDLDGTILDSNGAWIEVDEIFLRRRGLVTTPEYEEVVARSIFPIAAVFTKEYFHLPDSPEEIMAEWEELALEQYRTHAPLKPGAAEYLRRCHAAGERLALFTACRPVLCEAALQRFGLTELFEQIVYAEEIGLEKGDPNCFFRLAELLGIPPEECILFDDSPANCAAAAAAGMQTVGVYDRYYMNRQDELRAVCGRYVRSLEEL